MKLFHFALAFMLLLTACSKDDEKAQESLKYAEEMWTTDQHPQGVVITSNYAYVRRLLPYNSGIYWLDYGKIGSLQDIDIYNVITDFEDNDSSIPIQENHGYIMKYSSWSSGTHSIDYTAYYITGIHRDKNGNILYIKAQGRGFVPYQHWK